ncbi:hypothetical protein PC121_g9278 [Phytophthora cactorum]|nr:hypothetical protein PC120_g7023 [Phytophthora cactorum]KAG3071322.1 hypothetical protein PC121_g9278 [Phytophthora cactorum]
MSSFKDPINFNIQNKKRSPVNVENLQELSLVELLETDADHTSLQESSSSANPSPPGAQAYVNRFLARVKENAKLQGIRLTPGLTSHSFRRGGAMQANDGTVAENWIIERGGWQLDRTNKTFSYMLGTTQADQQVSRVLSGRKPKDGARLPALAALYTPVPSRPLKRQALLFTNTMEFTDQALNLDEDVAEVLTAALVLHYSYMLRLCDHSPFVTTMREAMSARAIVESELLA